MTHAARRDYRHRHGDVARRGGRDRVGEHPRVEVGGGADHPVRSGRLCLQDRHGSSPRRRPGRHLQHRYADRPQGASPGRSVHHLRHRRGRPGARGCRADRHDRGRALPRRHDDRLGHRRAAGHREGIDRSPRKGPAPRLAALRPRPADQPDLGPGQHQIRADGAEPCGRHRLLGPARTRSATPRG